MKQLLLKKRCLLPVVFALLALPGQAQVSITSSALTYTQNFDGIDQGTLALPTGWAFGFSGNVATKIATSSASLIAGTPGGTYLFASGTDQAIGILNGTTANDLANGQTVSFTFTNNTGKYITALSIGFNYEKYRNAPRSWTWRVTSSGTSGTISALSLAYGSDGNSNNNFPPLQTPVSGNITGLAIADGASYTITWTLTGASGTGNGQALAIDDFTMTATATTITSSSTDYYRSKQNGNWGDVSSWQSSSNGTNTWINATQTPGATTAGTSIQGGNTITVASNVTGSLVSVSGGATLAVNSGVNLTINNGPGTDLDIFGTVNNSGTITPTNASIIVESGGGAFNCLSASPTATGAIGNIGAGSITGTITVQQNLSAQRAYRLLGHPFNSNIAISNLQPYVDITGTGTGLTAGSASAYSYTPGIWTPYVNNTDTWNKNEALFLFVRGTPGQGIGQASGGYTPSAPTISLSGSVNTGNLAYTVKAASTFGGAAEGWNAIGNPYPAPIDVNSISGITSVGGSGASVYVWNATMGATDPGIASGGYDFRTLGSSFVIPVYGAFFIKNTSGLDQPITFSESNKSTGTPYAPFGGSSTPAEGFLLTIADSLTYWDKLKISFGNQFSTASTDQQDLDKFSNINLDFYSIGSDNKHLAINSRPVLQSVTDVIALGLQTKQERTFTIKVSDVNLATGSNLYLHDKYTNSWTKIANGTSYNFSVTADTASQGVNRFEVAMKAPEAPVTVAPSALTVQAGPNPIKNQLTIRYASPEATPINIRITDMNGKIINNINTGKVQSGVQQVATGAWGMGVYIIQVSNGRETVTEKLVKE